MIPVHRLDNAINYALDEKKSSRAENRESLEGEIDKALNKDQSEQDLFQSAIGCTIDSAFEDMCQIKKIWHKEKGVQGFHLVQSFAPGEISPELAHQIGMEFADRLLGGKFQAVVSTHLNTKCIHNHIVWNSVSMENGKKYRSNEKTYVTGVRKISDELCVKHRLSVIRTEKSEQVARPYALWLAEQNGTYTWKTPIQKDIEEAIAASLTWKQFLRVMEKQGYAFRFDRKYATMILPSTGRTVRFKTLGKTTPRKLSKTASCILSLLTGLGNKHLRPAASLFFLEKSRPAEFPACGRSTIPISTKWGRCRKSPGTQVLLCGKISASWISGSNRLNSFSKTILRTGGSFVPSGRKRRKKSHCF